MLRISPKLYVADTPAKGRGVYTRQDISRGSVVERSAVLVLSAAERQWIEGTELYNYIFEWGPYSKECCVAWGFISMYNHSYKANCEYEMHYGRQWMQVRTVRAIAAGEELTINYNGDWDNESKVWFATVDPNG